MLLVPTELEEEGAWHCISFTLELFQPPACCISIYISEGIEVLMALCGAVVFIDRLSSQQRSLVQIEWKLPR